MKDNFPLVHRKMADDGAPVSGHVIVCSACGKEDFFAARRGRVAAVHVAAKFTMRGWLVRDAGAHVCAACNGTFRAQKTSSKHVAADAIAPALPQHPVTIHSFEEAMSKSATVAPPAQMVRSPAAATGLGLLYMALADNFDPVKGRYRGDWSDEKVAKETGLALDFVRQRRETDFGPLNEGPDTDRLRAELVALERQHAGLVTTINAAAARGETIITEMRALATQVWTAVTTANLIAGKIDAIKTKFAPVTP